ncbi:MAG: 30S ribosomal protein S6 [Rhodobacteraceae bacterium]|nr:30S ribosomal protein S6 [Paracoccaceae bacterium]
MSLYEHVCITRKELSTFQVDNLSKMIEAMVEELGGSIVGKEYWGTRKFAYSINKNKSGHYLFFRLDTPPESINEIERRLRINEDIIRYLSIKVDQHSEEPTPLIETNN